MTIVFSNFVSHKPAAALSNKILARDVLYVILRHKEGGKLNIRCISQIFRVFPDSIIPVADDGSVEFPHEQGNFSLASYLSY